MKSYTITSLKSAGVKPEKDCVIKLQFACRSRFSDEGDGEFSCVIYDSDIHGLDIFIPATVRRWFFKIPEAGQGSGSRSVYLQGDGKSWEMIGTVLETGFKDAKIRWDGQEQK